MYRVDADTAPERLGDHKQTVGPRLAERRDDRPVVAFLGAGNGDLVEPGKPGLHRAERLLQRLAEAAPDRHGLAHRLHRGGEQGLGAGEFLEREARDLGHHVVDAGLEGGRRHTRDVVRDFVEGVADGELGRDLGNGEPGRLGRQRRRARDPRVHLDHDQAARGRVHGELDVGAAGLDAHLAQHRDGGVAHELILLVGKCQRRRYGDRIAGVDAHRVHVLDGTDDDGVVGLVAHDLHLELFPAEHRFFDEDLAGGRGVHAGRGELRELLTVVGDAAAGAAEGVGGPDDGRQPHQIERLAGLVE